MRKLYYALERLLINKGYLTLEISEMITRKGTRKEYVWGRHILDLCEFMLEHRNLDGQTEALLERCIRLTKK